MLIRSVLIASIIGAVAGTTVQAAPVELDISDYKTIDRFDHILHPDEEVGPEIDDDNPLLDTPMYQVDVWKFFDEPDPREIEVDIAVVR